MDITSKASYVAVQITNFFWSVFSRIPSEHLKIRIKPNHAFGQSLRRYEYKFENGNYDLLFTCNLRMGIQLTPRQAFIRLAAELIDWK